jgi:DNA-binding beta-propeller fold protein YncE
MKPRLLLPAIVCAAAFTLLFAKTAPSPPLTLVRTVDLPGIEGDLDHLSLDSAHARLLMTAEDNGTVRVIDLTNYKLAETVNGFKTPHSILDLPQAHTLFITDGSDAVQVRDSATYGVVKRISTTPGADSIGFDEQHGLLYAVTGGKDVDMQKSFLSVIDVNQAKLLREIPIEAAHVEAMALERSGPRLFVNVTDKNYLAIINRDTGDIVGRWPVKEAQQNAPITYDEEHHRLYVVCRQPGTLVVLDSDSGKTIASFPTGSRADEVIYDKVHHRVYVLAGEGKVYVYQTIDANHIEPLVPVPSAPGAKTGLLSPDGTKLYVSVSPGEGKTGAKLLVFDVN